MKSAKERISRKRKASQSICTKKNFLYWCSRGLREKIEFCLRRDQSLARCCTANGSTALHKAAASGDYLLVRLLVENGATVNARDDTQETPLHQSRCDAPPMASSATDYRKDEVVAELVNHRAIVDAKDCEGRTPLFGADFIKARTLLDRKAKLYVRDNDRDTVLHAAFVSRHPEETLRELFARGAGKMVNSVNKDGETPLVKFLRDLDEEHSRIYRRARPSSLVELLIQNGAKVNRMSKDGTSALHYAVSTKRDELAEILITHHAKITAQDKYGNTPLYLAVRNKDESIVRILLEAGAKAGQKEIALAKKMGFSRIHSLLER